MLKRHFLKQNSKPTFVANNGVEALEMLNSTIVPYLKSLFWTLIIPKMNGIEFLTIMKIRFKNISVFVMTTSNEDSDKINAYNLNVLDIY
jgi:CheY-like chemotaxis protein